jgi:hypothetical protein
MFQWDRRQLVWHKRRGDARKVRPPRLQEAARRATNMRKLLIQYTNELDRTWPYTKVARIIEIFTSINGRKATLESVEDDCFSYTVIFSPTLAKKRQRDDGHDEKQPFEINIDFSKYDRSHEVYIKQYIWPYSQMIVENTRIMASRPNYAEEAEEESDDDDDSDAVNIASLVS